MGESPKYPHRICVYCDSCGRTHCADYLVSTSDDRETRSGYARAYLSYRGWSFTDSGDLCPDCQHPEGN